MKPRPRSACAWAAAAVTVLVVSVSTIVQQPRAEEAVAAEADRLARVLGVEPGSAVAEIGAGGGEMTVAMARLAGENGHVYSTELGDEKVSALRDAVVRGNARTVTVVDGADDSTHLPAGCCDAIYMRRVYHHFTRPGEIDASLFAALRPGGRLAVVDFEPRGGTPPEGVPANRKGHGIPSSIVVTELTRAGFEHLRTEDWTQGMFLVLFRKPPGNGTWGGVSAPPHAVSREQLELTAGSAARRQDHASRRTAFAKPE